MIISCDATAVMGCDSLNHAPLLGLELFFI